MNSTISHRFFWSWDHSTNWSLHAYGAQNCGVANDYAKAPGMFEVDYRRVVDFCAAHRIDAVGIAGLFREKHGRVESVRRLCEYANRKGVRIYQIARLFAYGGIFYDGRHPYSMNHFFEKNPDCIARTESGQPFSPNSRESTAITWSLKAVRPMRSCMNTCWNRWTGCSGKSPNWAAFRWRPATTAFVSVRAAVHGAEAAPMASRHPTWPESIRMQ